MLITLDRGFGDVRVHPPGSHPGIVVPRPSTQVPFHGPNAGDPRSGLLRGGGTADIRA